MKSSEICSLAINIGAWNYGEVQYRMNNTTYYPDHTWNLLTWYNNAWHADCLGLVRAVLCGWHADKTVTAGGADMSYGCYNFNEIAFLNSCSSNSTDFTLLSAHPCSLLYKQGHVGIYVGEFQLNGLTYNSVECTTSFDMGGRPTYVDDTGLRHKYKGSSQTAGYWTHWGIFNLNGTDYGITEYDGGSTGATGFGTALVKSEVEYYWDTLTNLTYDYVQTIAENIHGMSADVFAVMAGWGWGEGYANAVPVGETDPDRYMGYLADCIPVNYFEGLGISTGPAMADRIRGGGGSYYSYQNMIDRAQDLKNNESTNYGQNELRALLLALLNPDQNAYYCNGYPGSNSIIIYQKQYSGPGMIYVFYESWEKVPYDITGSGIRGGQPRPAGWTSKMPIWMYLRPKWKYNQNIFRI